MKSPKENKKNPARIFESISLERYLEKSLEDYLKEILGYISRKIHEAVLLGDSRKIFFGKKEIKRKMWRNFRKK